MHTTSLPLHWACSSLLQLPFHASFFCCLEAHTTSGAFAAPVGFIIKYSNVFLADDQARDLKQWLALPVVSAQQDHGGELVKT